MVFPNEMQLNFSEICVSLLHEMPLQMTTLSVPKVTRQWKEEPVLGRRFKTILNKQFFNLTG